MGRLFALMGVGAGADLSLRSLRRPLPGPDRLFVQLGFNFFWSILFFNLQAFGPALLWLLILWGLILWMILSFRRVDQGGRPGCRCPTCCG